MSKYYKPTVKKKSTREIPICEYCLSDPTGSDLKNWDFFWVEREGYCSLSCINCIEKLNLVTSKIYRKKPGRPKKSLDKSTKKSTKKSKKLE